MSDDSIRRAAREDLADDHQSLGRFVLECERANMPVRPRAVELLVWLRLTRQGTRARKVTPYGLRRAYGSLWLDPLLKRRTKDGRPLAHYDPELSLRFRDVADLVERLPRLHFERWERVT